MDKFLGLRLNRSGFTLIEMLVVLGIIGALAAIILAVLNPIEQLRKSSDAKRKSDLAQIQRALEIYNNDNKAYPVSTGTFQITGANWGSAWNPYITKVPQDPKSGHTYVYFSNGQSYYLYANLERGTKDPQACSSGGAGVCSSLTANGIAASKCGGTGCNFAVTSPDVSP